MQKCEENADILCIQDLELTVKKLKNLVSTYQQRINLIDGEKNELYFKNRELEETLRNLQKTIVKNEKNKENAL